MRCVSVWWWGPQYAATVYCIVPVIALTPSVEREPPLITLYTLASATVRAVFAPRRNNRSVVRESDFKRRVDGVY